jgi:hypothetical protein
MVKEPRSRGFGLVSIEYLRGEREIDPDRIRNQNAGLEWLKK